jgi:MoaA/NifB/PqqE/SkfB family radical SAM enzyme
MMMGVLKTRVLKKRMVRSVELAVTYNCNLRCDKCFALKWLEEKKSKFLTVDEIKKLWDQAYAMGATHVNLTGGEPIGRKDIADVVRALKPRGTLISLVTNGIMVTEEKIIALRKAGLNTLQVSLDSSKPELHDRYRGYKGCYDKAINAARLALKHGLNVCFTTIATHENIKTDDLPEMLKIARKMGILLLINFAGRSGGWHEKDFLTLTKEDKKVLDKYMKDPYARLSQMFNYYLKPGMCLMGKDKFNVSAYGEVYPCTHVFLKFGNIRDEPLKDILYRMNHFKHFKDITYDCPRCDHQDFIEEYMDPIARDERPMLDVDKDFGYVHTEGVKVS